MSVQQKKQPENDKKAGSGKKSGKEKPITVHAYSGYKTEEKPRSFELDGRRLTILSIKQTWQEESSKSRRKKTCFRVHAHDGRTYVIALDAGSGQWTLEPQE